MFLPSGRCKLVTSLGGLFRRKKLSFSHLGTAVVAPCVCVHIMLNSVEYRVETFDTTKYENIDVLDTSYLTRLLPIPCTGNAGTRHISHEACKHSSEF